MSIELYLFQAGLYVVLVFGLLARAVWRGRRLWARAAERHPELYEALGRPLPGFFDSPRRARHFEILNRREYEQIDDETLVDAFERLRGFEYRMFYVLMGGLLYLGAVGYWYKDTWPV